MNIRKKRTWELPEKAATPEGIYLDRRRILAGLGLGGAILAAPAALRMAPARMRSAQAEPESSPDRWADLYPVQRNSAYRLDRPLTEESWATSYNNFYEFGSHKQIARAAQSLDPVVARPRARRARPLVASSTTVRGRHEAVPESCGGVSACPRVRRGTECSGGGGARLESRRKLRRRRARIRGCIEEGRELLGSNQPPACIGGRTSSRSDRTPKPAGCCAD